MSAVATLLVGLVIVVGIVGAVVQVWPSGPVVGGAILVWAIAWKEPIAWVVFAIAAIVLVAAAVAKYVIPGRRLTRSGIPASTVVWGLVGAVVGFFVIPVVGFLIGLVAAIYLSELFRLGSHEGAWPATLIALAAVGLSVLIELLAVLVAAGAWLVGVILV